MRSSSHRRRKIRPERFSPVFKRAFALSFLALIPRVWLGTKEFNLDELTRWQAASGPLEGLWHRTIVLMGGNPLFSLLLHPWAGESPSVTLRIPGILVGSLVPAMLYVLFRRTLGEKGAWLAGLWMASSPFHVGISAELKEYSFALPLQVLALWLSVRIVKERRTDLPLWLALGSVGSLAVLLSLPGIFSWGGLALGIVAAWDRKDRAFPWRMWGCVQALVLAGALAQALDWPASNETAFQKGVSDYRIDPLSMAAQLLTGLECWLPGLPRGLVGWVDGWLRGHGIVVAVERGFEVFYFASKILVGGVVVSVAAWSVWKERTRGEARLMGIQCVAAPALYLIAFTARGYPHLYLPQAFLGLSPALAILVLRGIGELSALRRCATSGLLIAVLTISLATQLLGVWPHPYSPIGHVLKKNVGAVSAWVYPADAVHYVRYNAPGEARAMIQPLGPTVLDRPETWQPLFESAYRVENAARLSRLPEGAKQLIVVVPYLQWSDPAIEIVDRSKWRIVAEDGMIRIFESAESGEGSR